MTSSMLKPLFILAAVAAANAAINQGGENQNREDFMKESESYICRGLYEGQNTCQKCYDEIIDAEQKKQGHWTQWLNGDKSMGGKAAAGIGEFETWSRFDRLYDCEGDDGIHCTEDSALVVQVKLTQKEAFSVGDVVKCYKDQHGNQLYKLSPDRGFSCQERDIKNLDRSLCTTQECDKMHVSETCNLCPDVMVRFFCRNRSCQGDKREQRDFIDGEVDREIYRRNHVDDEEEQLTDEERDLQVQKKEEKEKDLVELLKKLLTKE